MSGGNDNVNSGFPVLLDERRLPYDANAFPQLQLFGDCPVGCGIDHLNYMGGKNMPSLNWPFKRSREAQVLTSQQKFHMSLNNKDNLYQNKVREPENVVNLNLASTGLGLSNEEAEPIMLPVISFFGDHLKTEMDRQKQEFDLYMRLQEENIIKVLKELKQRHTASFLSVIEKEVGQKIQEKELEIKNMNLKNKELVEKIKQVTLETQALHQRAKYNEFLANVLRNNLNQVMAEAAFHSREGCGENNKNDDAVSSTNLNPVARKGQIFCRSCKVKQVNVLLMPCRHLCLCAGCEGVVDACPVCEVLKTASVRVFMP